MVVHNCEQCSKKFTHKRYLTKHVARMHTNRVEPELSNRHLTCSLCDKGVHAIFRCDRCKETIEGRRALLQHSMRCREEAHVCTNCSATFPNKSLLRLFSIIFQAITSCLQIPRKFMQQTGLVSVHRVSICFCSENSGKEIY
ncbi:hypothetical protein WR25_01646 isoform B [Diploscapter pachys]|uniref:C2H2-type domain-containing protein n=1 Tax=Diploscapter pachys TaxID=2018661 RepID=A0A2A2JS01_9BILA|nr:hypothetical protein WR25_01646 isoform B [Diploscapter pachys]